MNCSPPGSSIHGILQVRILEWVAIPFSRGIFLTQGLNLGLLPCLSHQTFKQKWKRTIENEETLPFSGVLVSASIFEGVASETAVLKLCAWGTQMWPTASTHKCVQCPHLHLSTSDAAVPTRISSHNTSKSRSRVLKV